MCVFPAEQSQHDALVMFTELRKALPRLSFVIVGILAALAWNHPGPGVKKLGDWSPSAFLRASSIAGTSSTADNTAPVWLQELEVIGVATAGESIAVQSTDPRALRRQVARTKQLARR
jgi:hypothetical protein